MVILALRALPDRDHGAGLLAGLILVTAMPVATGATVWIGKGDGDQPTMVALIVTSTLISPVTVPLTVAALAALLDDAVADVLEGGTRAGANSFTLLTVVLPCAAGIAGRLLLPGGATALLLRICGPGALLGSLLLTYSNASGAIGSFLQHPDVALMTFATALATAVCLVSFTLGRWAARGLRLHPPAATSVTLACGMSNSSAGAVLVSTLMPTRPHALLPVLAYSLVQKVAANRFSGRER